MTVARLEPLDGLGNHADQFGNNSYKKPAVDDFLNAVAPEQVELFEAQEVPSLEGG